MTNDMVLAPMVTIGKLPAIALDRRARAHRPEPQQRFKIVPFINPSSEKVWRVSGVKRTGERIRENYTDPAGARCRQTELEAEYLARTGEATALRSTRLSEVQARIAETVFPMLERDDELLTAVNFWRQNRHLHVAVESPRIDDAVDQYLAWLENGAPFRDATKRHWKTRMNVFKNGISNHRVAEITPEILENFLAKRNTSPAGKDTDRRAISRFFSWCIERPRRWAVSNPASVVRIDQGEKAPPAILTLDDCEKLFSAAKKYKRGLLVPYVAVCLIGGLRPDEAKRLTWQAVNLNDKEIRLESNQTKTKTPRVVKIHPTLAAWLKAYEGKSFFPVNWRKHFDAVKARAGFTGRIDPEAEADKKNGKTFPHDVMRHTAISHFFRDCGSYGLTAEQFGNSEAIIKKHYQSRVSSADTKKFYSIEPKAAK